MFRLSVVYNHRLVQQVKWSIATSLTRDLRDVSEQLPLLIRALSEVTTTGKDHQQQQMSIVGVVLMWDFSRGICLQFDVVPDVAEFR